MGAYARRIQDVMTLDSLLVQLVASKIQRPKVCDESTREELGRRVQELLRDPHFAREFVSLAVSKLGFQRVREAVELWVQMARAGELEYAPPPKVVELVRSAGAQPAAEAI